MSRPIALRDAVHERYAYGRLFGYSRRATCSTGRPPRSFDDAAHVREIRGTAEPG